MGHRLARGLVHGIHPLFGMDHLPRKIPTSRHLVDNRHDDIGILRWQSLRVRHFAKQRERLAQILAWKTRIK